jgi:hypothetical protein
VSDGVDVPDVDGTQENDICKNQAPISGLISAAKRERDSYTSLCVDGVDVPDVDGASRKTAPISGGRSAGVKGGLATLHLNTHCVDSPDVDSAGGPVPVEEPINNMNMGQAKAAVSSFIELDSPGEGSPSRGSTYHKGVARPLPGMDFPPAQDQGHDGARQSPLTSTILQGDESPQISDVSRLLSEISSVLSG